MVRRKLRDTEVDTRNIPSSPDGEIRAWLGIQCVSWEPEGLIIRGHGGRLILAPAGWTLVKWDDGWVTLMSPESEHRTLGDEVPD